MKKCEFLVIFLLFSFVNAFSIVIEVIDRDIEIPLEGVRVLINGEDSFFSDPDGKIEIKDSLYSDRFVLKADLIGYTSKEMLIETKDNEIITIYMSMENYIEGNELVVESEKVNVSDAEVGVSTVVDKEALKSSAESGIVEDVVSSVKKLPGVSYGGSFNTSISVRGGNPDEFGISLDGFKLRYPYHWAGVFSILNPSIIQGIKFSSGIFGAKTGMATSGFLEATTLRPDETLKIKGGIATTSADFIVSSPIKDIGGFYVGLRASFIDLPAEIYKTLQREKLIKNAMFNLKKAPYFEDLYFKIFFQPDERFEWYFNAFFGNDGLQTKNEIEHNNIESVLDMQYLSFNTFAFTGVKILPNDSVFINIMTGYEFLFRDNKQQSIESGVTDYSDEFIEYYQDKYGVSLASDSYKIDDLQGERELNINSHNVQGKIDIDLMLTDFIIMSVGGGLLYEYNISKLNGQYYGITQENGNFFYDKLSYNMDSEDYQLTQPFLYFSLNFNLFNNRFKIETGFRVDYFYYNSENTGLSSYPFVSPRFNMIFGILKDKAVFKHIGMSLGGGLFGMSPFNGVMISKNMDKSKTPKLFDIQHTKNVTAVLGLEAMFLYGFRLRMEGYYKYYFHRTYKIGKINEQGNINFSYNSDGSGHSAGFDIVLDRKISRFIDGQIAYSFSFVKLFNPQNGGIDTDANIDNSANISDSRRKGVPVGIWYYPSYHRFHNFNISLNIKPVSWFTISPSLTFASGSPKIKYGDKEAIDVNLSDDSIAEMYTRSEEYSDEERGDFFIPFNLKLLFHHYFPRQKIGFEVYIGIEDLFGFLYQPVTNVTTNRFSGDEMVIAESTFSIPIPIPSIGFKLQF